MSKILNIIGKLSLVKGYTEKTTVPEVLYAKFLNSDGKKASGGDIGK